MRWVSSGAPIVESTMQGLVEDGLLVAERFTDHPWVYKPTDKLAAYVAMLCQTPLPVYSLIDPRNNKAVSP